MWLVGLNWSVGASGSWDEEIPSGNRHSSLSLLDLSAEVFGHLLELLIVGGRHFRHLGVVGLRLRAELGAVEFGLCAELVVVPRGHQEEHGDQEGRRYEQEERLTGSSPSNDPIGLLNCLTEHEQTYWKR